MFSLSGWEKRKLSSLLSPLLFFFFILFFFFSYLLAQRESTATLNLRVFIEKRCKIEISSSLISFVRTSTQGNPQIIPANENPVEVAIKTNLPKGAEARVWFLATSDLVDNSAGYTIEVETISWEAKGDGFFSGQLSKSSPSLLARIGGAGKIKGLLNFFFAEDPNFAPGNYQTTVTLFVEAL